MHLGVIDDQDVTEKTRTAEKRIQPINQLTFFLKLQVGAVYCGLQQNYCSDALLYAGFAVLITETNAASQN